MEIGDKVICNIDGVCGEIVKIYKPTACEKQIMVRTHDGRTYHAPYPLWRKEVKGGREYD